MKNSFDIEDLYAPGEQAKTLARYIGNGSESFMMVG
jgi:hypothetical protein